MQLFFHINIYKHIAGSISITEMKYFPASSALLKMQRFRFKNEKRFWMNDSISQASLGHNDARRGPTMRVDDQLAASLEEKKLKDGAPAAHHIIIMMVLIFGVYWRYRQAQINK